MTDITRKLELLAKLETGALWPIELGPELGAAANWGTAVSAICAEALAEIQRLRAHERASEKWLAELVPYQIVADPASAVDWKKLGNDMVGEVISKVDAIVSGPGLRIISRPDGSFVAKDFGPDGVALNSMAHPELPEPAPRAFTAVETNGKPIAEVVDPHGEPWGSPFAMNSENWK